MNKTTNKEPAMMTRELTPAAAAAKVLRAELKAAFPGVKFTVRSRNFSGGDALDIGWTDGPAYDAVNAIAGRFQEGSFDGSIDLYTYSKAEAGCGAKFVHCNREISKAIAEQIETDLRALLSADDFYIDREVYRILRESDLRAGYVGLAHDDENTTGSGWIVVTEGAACSIVRATVEQAPAAAADESAPVVIEAEVVEAVPAVESVPVAITDEVTEAVIIDASTVDAVARVGAWWDAVRAIPAGEAVAA
jgi:hypothetical protein